MDQLATIQDLKRRLAEATTEAARLAVLLEFGRQTKGAQRADAEAEVYLREAIDLARKVGTDVDLTTAGIAASEFYRNSGEMVRSLECAEVVQEAAGSSGNSKSQGHYFFLVGRVSEEQGDYERARDCYERCLSVWRDTGFTRGVPSALHQLGRVAALQGHEAEALERFQESLKSYEEIGDVACQVYSRQSIGWALQRLGRWEDAIECYYRTMAVAEQHDLPTVRASALNCLGELFLERDKTAKAIDIFKMVQEAAESGKAAPHLAREALCNLGLAFHRQRDFAGAEQAFRRALDSAETSQDRRTLALVHWSIAELALDQGQLDRCRELAERSAAIAGEIGVPSEEAQASRVLGLLHAARGEDEQAHACFEHAIELLHNLEEGVDLARVRFHYGRYLLGQGEAEQALSCLKAASHTFRRLGVVVEAQAIDRLLFQQEMDVNRDMALLQGMSGLASLGFEPQVLLERAIGLLLEVLGFDGAAVVARGRPLLMTGEVDMKRVSA
ncbi:tetratricopeptide repeat protein, partial [candidate division WOR-3 bacterium]|nr:tetratricopeptide repeat protein [candidate division WOR-3 bacterium]